jgi:hypothetical protein
MPFSLSSSALNDYQRYLSLLVGNDAYVDVVPLTVDYLVIAGGGAGGSSSGAGGGAGGYRCSVSGESSGGGASAESSLTLDTASTYTVTVGAGGSGNSSSLKGIPGSNSVFDLIISTGGGGGAGTSGGQREGPELNGGSGGGAYVTGSAGTGTTNQGYDGGTAIAGDAAAGGGGAGAVGSNAVSGQNGAGGTGVSSAITGSSIGRAGGGGGGSVSGQSAGTATDGGGAGSTGGGNGTSGIPSTGGGGGGAYWTGSSSTTSGNGGSGVVIVKYPAVYTMSVGAGLGYKTFISGDYKITEFTAGTGTVSFAVETADLGPSEDILQEIVLESSASSVTFSGLDAYASEYQHLQVRMILRSDRAASDDWANFIYNSDTGSNYSQHSMRGNGSTVAAVAVATSSNTQWAAVTAASSTTANVFGPSVVDILDPFETSKNTTLRSLHGFPNALYLSSGAWYNTNALTSIEIKPIFGSNWVANSRFTLIGVK